MSISLYQLIPYEREDVNGLFVEFTVGNPVPPSFLSARLTKISLIFLVGALRVPTPLS